MSSNCLNRSHHKEITPNWFWLTILNFHIFYIKNTSVTTLSGSLAPIYKLYSEKKAKNYQCFATDLCGILHKIFLVCLMTPGRKTVFLCWVFQLVLSWQISNSNPCCRKTVFTSVPYAFHTLSIRFPYAFWMVWELRTEVSVIFKSVIC